MPELTFVFNAFMELSTCRSIGMGEGPIPWTAIRAYAEAYDLTDPDDLDYFTELVHAMDSAYLSHRSKQRK